MALSPALAAIVVAASAQPNVGINGSINGLLTRSFKPRVTCTTEEYRNEQTNPALLIHHTHDLSFTIEADVRSRTIDLAGANLGAGLPLASMPFIVDGNRFGFPITTGGGYTAGNFVLIERDDTTERGKLNTVSLTLRYWDYVLPEFPPA